jgi:hypothetical protein
MNPPKSELSGKFDELVNDYKAVIRALIKGLSEKTTQEERDVLMKTFGPLAK